MRIHWNLVGTLVVAALIVMGIVFVLRRWRTSARVTPALPGPVGFAALPAEPVDKPLIEA